MTRACLAIFSLVIGLPPVSDARAQGSESCDTTPDVMYYGGTVLTMNPGRPTAQALAVKADTIIAVGTDEEVLALADPDCHVATADLAGRTILPGFNESHAHWFSWPEHICSVTGETTYPRLEEIMPMLSANGWTSFSELNFGRPDYAPAHFNNAMDLDSRGELSVRVTGYWGTYDDPSMIDVLAAAGRTPEARYSDRIHAPGVKIYVDNPFGHFDILSQEEVDALVQRAHDAGWQVAAHAVNQSAVDKILSAYERVLGPDSNDSLRYRIEHAVKVSDDQLARMEAKGIIASFQLLGPPDWPAQEDFGDRFLTDHPEWVLRWNDFVAAEPAGLRITGSSDAPFNDAPCDPSPFRMIYQAVTRNGYVDRTPADWELAQRITIEDGIRLLTIDGAYATFDEDMKGSLEPGKWADFVILSDNPLDVAEPEELLDIQVLLTSVGGATEFCNEDAAGDLCSPSASFTVPGGVVRASAYLSDQTPDLAFDGQPETNWGAGDGPPQWIELALDEPMKIGGIDLVTEQFPDGRTVHEIFAGQDPEGSDLLRLTRFGGTTTAGQTLSYDAPSDLPAYRVFRVVTSVSPSWVSWREITLRPFSATAAHTDYPLPGSPTMLRHYPNPVVEHATFQFQTAEATSEVEWLGEAKLVVYDVFGRVVRQWMVRTGSGAPSRIEWDGTSTDGRRVASGLYVYRLTSNGRTLSGRMILTR